MREVVVAQYTWRYEAEFAAGFLRDANIPHRLQIDDPALGISISSPATLWVLGMDEERAQDILDIDGENPPRLSGRVRTRQHAGDKAIHLDLQDPEAKIFAQHLKTNPAPNYHGTKLVFQARALSVIGGIGIAGIGHVFLLNWSLPGPGPVVACMAAVLVLIGIVGRAPRGLRNLLMALSGSAP